jgi:alkanesulfonate monooxygenase SsuD/methylene tetrahydromethanopterin reductase-like flavin-dependent oxidoreductase (luciferase family)/pimeloyl-ACP methyl ester carboxylesterase
LTTVPKAWRAEFVETAGARVQVIKGGTGDPLLVLHGELGHPGWMEYHRRLAGSRSLWAPLLPGYGESQPVDWVMTMRDMAGWCLDALDEWGLGPVDVLGFSLGGWLAAEMAAMDPRMFRRLALVCPAGIKPPHGEVLDIFPLGAQELIAKSLRDPAATPEYRVVCPEQPGPEQAEFWERAREQTCRLAWKPYMHDPALPHLLRRTRGIPTLILWGKQDPIIPVSAGEPYTQSIESARLVVLDNCGHHPELERTDEFVATVERFFAQSTIGPLPKGGRMLIGHFTERPYQDPKSGYFGATGRPITDLSLSNGDYDPQIGADLYNRYIEEKVYAEEVGFDGLVLNEHHSTPFCMGGATNVEAAVLAHATKKAKIILLGNVLPIWEDPLWLVEQLAIIDLISRGRLVPGWVRGTGRESYSHNAPPHHNWERFQEAHDFVIKAWTVPGPWRWEGKHFHYRYVNPWCRPYQQPHPPIWIPGVASKSTIEWCVKQRYPYVMLATDLEATRDSFAVYHALAREAGWESGPQNVGYMFRVHVDETEELAEQAGRKFLQGPSNPFLAGNEGRVNPFIQNLPGITSRRNLLPTATKQPAGRSSGGLGAGGNAYEEQIKRLNIICGTPDTVLPKIRHVLETLRPGIAIFWDGDGAMTHEDQMRSLRLFGEYVLPAVREMGKELDLPSPFEVDPATGKPVAGAGVQATATR